MSTVNKDFSRIHLPRLLKGNRELRTERDILKQAAEFFAKHQAYGRYTTRCNGAGPLNCR